MYINKRKLKENAPFYAFLLVLIVLVYFLINFFVYFDPFRMCVINVNGDVLYGGKKSIYNAIRLIKKDDKNTYKDVCKYVDRIVEKHCLASIGRGLEKKTPEWAEGCYIKGSKVIYIQPEMWEARSGSVERNRAEKIKKYAEMSREFWEGLKK